METEYYNNWDDHNDTSYGNNDVPATKLRRYSSSPSPQRKLSRSRSRSRGRHSLSNNYYNGNASRRSYSRRSRSRSRSPSKANGRRERSLYRSRSRSRSRYHRGSFDRHDHHGSSPNNAPFIPQAPPRRARENPDPTNVLGIFNLDYYTNEQELRDIFEPFGGLERVVIVMDRRSQRSRGFAFVYFSNVDSASRAREATNGKIINDRGIRVDFSVTKEAHQPTPGIYMGESDRSSSGRGGGSGGRYNNSRYGGSGRGGGGGSGGGYRSRRRSRSRSNSRSRGRFGDRSYYRNASPPSVNHRYRSRSRSR